MVEEKKGVAVWTAANLDKLVREIATNVQRVKELRAAAPSGIDLASFRQICENMKDLVVATRAWHQVRDRDLANRLKACAEASYMDQKEIPPGFALAAQFLENQTQVQGEIKQIQLTLTARTLGMLSAFGPGAAFGSSLV